MKLLLTSNGLSNESIIAALKNLVNKPLNQSTICIVPTASNGEPGDKSWLIKDFNNVLQCGFTSVEIADIDLPSWSQSISRADIIYVCGGNVYHLMRSLNASGLSNQLKDLLTHKVYVGVSAGSMVCAPTLALPLSQEVYQEDLNESEDLKGLSFIDFYIAPHLNSQFFPLVKKENVEKVSLKKPIYALDDDSAIVINENQVEVVSEGEWFVIKSHL